MAPAIGIAPTAVGEDEVEVILEEALERQCRRPLVLIELVVGVDFPGPFEMLDDQAAVADDGAVLYPGATTPREQSAAGQVVTQLAKRRV